MSISAAPNTGLAAVEEARPKLRELCRKHCIRRLSLFGSILRDDFGPESDIDVLAEFEASHVPGFIRLAGMEMELSTLLDRKVDLLTPGSLSPRFRDRVLREAFMLHDAA